MPARVSTGSGLAQDGKVYGAWGVGLALIAALALMVATCSGAAEQVAATAAVSKNPIYMELCEKNLTSGRRPRLCDNFYREAFGERPDAAMFL